MQCCAESGSAMSVLTKTASPLPSSSRIAPAARSSTTSATTTLAPSARNRCAYARPIPCPAPVMIATLSWSRPIHAPLRLLLEAGDEVESLGHDRFRGLGVGPLGLHDNERHARAVGLLLIDVGDLLETVEHVARDRRAVVRELLLAVQHERALRVELAHDRVHRVALARGRIGRLLIGTERAPVGGGKRERRRRGNRREARGARVFFALVHAARVT